MIASKLRIPAIALAIALCLIQVSCASTDSSRRPKETSASLAANSKPPAKKAPPKAAAKKLPKLLDLGADKCIPCKMMAPILKELAKEYKGQLDVQFIDVWKDQNAAEKYKIKSIPTQIFYDAKGKEFFRHVGFFSKEDILKTFEKQGIKLKKPPAPKEPAGK